MKTANQPDDNVLVESDELGAGPNLTRRPSVR